MATTSTGASKSPVVLEIKLTEVFDVISFWAQIGTTKHFTAYDQQLKEMSAWCDECPAGCHQNSSSLKLESIVAVRGKTKGKWVRSKVMKIMSDKLVELLYVDTGVTDYADVRSICVQTPPMLCSIPQQALQCLLAGIKLPEGEKEWSKKANSRFTELTSAHAKAVHHGTQDGNCIMVSVFVPYKGVFMSVGEVLRQEGLVEYAAPGPLALDIPVPRELVALNALLEDADTMPINCYITNTLLHQRQVARAASYISNQEHNLDLSEAEDTKTVLENKEDILNSTSVDCGPPATPYDRVVIGSPNKSHLDDNVIPISAHPVESDGVPRTSSREDSEQFEDIDDGLTSPPLLIAETARRGRRGLPEMVAMKRAALRFTAKKPDRDEPDRDEAPQTAPLPETKAVSRGDHIVEATSSATKENTADNRKPLLLDSGSELSDNDWLDEELLPRRSGNSEVSDIQLESPVKDLQSVTPEGAPGVTSDEGLWDKTTPHELFPRNHILDTVGNTPYPRKPQVQLYTHPYTGRSLRGVFQNMSKDSWSPRGPPKGRGKGKGKNKGEGFGGVKKSNSEDKEKRQGAMMLKGRGRGAREKFSHRNPAPCNPPLLELPVLRPANEGTASRPPDHSASESQRDRPVGFGVRMPVTVVENVSIPDHSTSENQHDRHLGFDTRRPRTMAENASFPDRSPSESQHDRLMGFSVRRPAVAEHSSSGSPPKLVSSSPEYSQRVKGMSDLETDHEVRWQEWRIEEGAAKILKSLSTENVDDFGEGVGKLICGTAAAKLRELPKYRNPLQMVVECMVERGVAKTLAPSLFMSALENMMEGPDGAEVQKVWLNVIGWKASQVIESGSAELKFEEGSTKCHTFCWLLGYLFCSNSSKCREMLIETVSCCLVIWTNLVPKDSDDSGKTEEQCKLNYERFERRCNLQVECFGALLDAVYASPSVVALEEVIRLLLSGQVPECVLCDYYPRYVRQAWHSESVKVRKPPTFEVLPTAQGLQESVAGVEWSQVQRRMEPNQLQGMELNQPQQETDGTPSHLGMELNQMQQGMERMELNRVQQVNPSQQGTDLNRDQVVMTYPHSFSPQLPSSPAPTAHNISPQSGLPLTISPSGFPGPGVPSYPQYQMAQGEALPKPDSYTRVMAVLEALHLTELFPKFIASMIKDPVLDCADLMGVKDCLKDAGIPSGPVLQILYYLENLQKLGSTGRVQGKGYRARHASHMSNPAASTLVQRALYLPSSTASPSPQHYSPGVAATASLPGNPYISGEQQQENVSPPYQVPVSDSTSSLSMYDTAPEGVYSGGKTHTYQMQRPPLGNKAAWMKQPPQRSAQQNVPQQQMPQQNVPLQQQMPQQTLQHHLQQQIPQQNVPQQQMPQQNVPLQQQMPQQNAPLQQQMPQQNALRQHMPQQNALQQQMPQQNALRQQMPQQNALQQQENALQQQMPQQNALQQNQQQMQPAVIQQQMRPRQQMKPPAQRQPSPTQKQPQKTTLRQLMQRVTSLQQQQPEFAIQQQMPQPLSPPAVMRQQSTRASPKQDSAGVASASKDSPVTGPIARATSTATPPGRSSEWDAFNFPPLPVRKPRTAPAQLPANTQFQLPATRPQISGFGRINCVVCGGMDHMTPDCSQRSKFFTHM